jgi:two-component system, NarL family, response regulator NreC
MSAAPAGASAQSAPERRKTRVLVVDEAGIMRDGLCALLQSDDALEVVAATASRREAVQNLTIAQPDVIVIDFAADLKAGPETILHLKSRWADARVLVLTVRRDETFIEAALRAGADGYVLKTDSRAELFNAVHRIASGKSYISPSALDRMVTAYAKTSDRPGRTRGSGALTSREQEVITLIAKGYRTREMAELMSLSHKTVEKHRTNLMRKLGLRSAAAVAAYAITHGFA